MKHRHTRVMARGAYTLYLQVTEVWTRSGNPVRLPRRSSRGRIVHKAKLIFYQLRLGSDREIDLIGRLGGTITS